MASRNTWVSNPAVGSASVIDGRTMDVQPFAPDTGNHRRLNENNIRNRMPSQNTGVEANTSSSSDATRRERRPRPAVSNASPTASAIANTPASKAS